MYLLKLFFHKFLYNSLFISINFNEIKAQAIEDLKAGKSLVGIEGALTPLIKQIIEASLEGG